MTQNVREIEIPNGELAFPKPLDPEIMGGFALASASDDDTLDRVALHLQQSFDVLRSKAVHPANTNRAKEIGQCIAYSVFELDATDVSLIDSYTRQVSTHQNHGMKTSDAKLRDISPNLAQIWLGHDTDSKHIFKLIRNVGTLVLEDGSTIENSSIWALKAAPTKTSWGWM
jgi:hypothetical protein